jgi:hypothetical protein
MWKLRATQFSSTKKNQVFFCLGTQEIQVATQFSSTKKIQAFFMGPNTNDNWVAIRLSSF